ncbi:MAG: hypothetical protein L0I24_08485, partial [Pseudonocardia sp.]|nr:hypothetical protein [Pseudonocardia sp.]
MPERQSSPGEATTRPEADAATNGSTHGPDGGSAPAPAGPNGSTGGGVEPPTPQGAEPGTDAEAAPVAEQVAAEPAAADPAPAEPGDGSADGGEPVMTGDRAVDIAEDPHGDPRTGDPQAADGPPRRTSLFEPSTPPGDGPSLNPAARAAAASSTDAPT